MKPLTSFDIPEAPTEQPIAPEMGDPQWVLDTWRWLYHNFPSPGLKERVDQAKQQLGG